MQMKPAIEIAGARVFLGDCVEVMRSLPDNSVDSVVTDPPYELNFMSKKWDNTGIAYDATVWQECLRVLKPGGHILAFGGSRTWHRLAVAVEDAGFELRDSIAWIYGSGFPKSLDVSKAIDKRLGAEREVTGQRVARVAVGDDKTGARGRAFGDLETSFIDETAPSSSEAQQWQGWGTALKPAFEPIVVGRKPLIGTVAENVLLWGVGGLNIDGSRIGSEVLPAMKSGDKSLMGGLQQLAGNGGAVTPERTGRWPANVVLDEFTAGLLDEQSGVSKVGGPGRSKSGAGGVFGGGDNSELNHYGDTGGASRFFYQAKASKRDRNEGLEDLDAGYSERDNGFSDKISDTKTPRQNFHPTVKPTQLMRYLIKLVTPEGGTVLDPFTGSGSTGKAALLDGYEFIGAELTEEYLPIIEGRLRWALEQEGEDDDTLF